MQNSESGDQVEARLLDVIARADTDFLAQDYAWAPLAAGAGPRDDALACVRDKDAWHEFVPAGPDDDPARRFRVVCFRFAEGPSAAGFVGWLHTHLRVSGRTGAIVICGKDRRDSDALFQVCQGVMDYWACPLPAADRFLDVIRSLIEKGQAAR